MKCPHCQNEINIGRLIGSVKSKRKTESSRRNGKLGGRKKMSAIADKLTKDHEPENLVKRLEQEALPDVSQNHRCQGQNCKRTDTVRTEVFGHGVWVCPAHSGSGTP